MNDWGADAKAEDAKRKRERENETNTLLEENARLRAELSALRPRGASALVQALEAAEKRAERLRAERDALLVACEEILMALTGFSDIKAAIADQLPFEEAPYYNLAAAIAQAKGEVAVSEPI